MHDHNHVKATYTLNRRSFLATIGTTYSALAQLWLEAAAAESSQPVQHKKQDATV
jgi:hypothetical protein